MSAVNLVWATPKGDELVAYMARVSNPSNQNNTATAPKLVKYLVDNKHWSPLDMVDMCVEITTTRDIARQILRHRSFYFQEFSQRYADPTEDLGFRLRDARLQDKKNRQNSIETSDYELKVEWVTLQQEVVAQSNKAYKWAIENGVAKEQARAVLPEGLTLSRMYMKGTLRNWIHYVDVRTDKATQKEHRLIAEECKKHMLECFPSMKELYER
jgi:thymidylate synthase (FAD)